MMRAVFQHQIKSSHELRAHWGAWHSNYSDKKKERIALFEKNFQDDRWNELMASREGKGLMPYEYVSQGFFS